MRPVERGVSPQATDFHEYRDAFKELVSRMGPYCSYCERRIATGLAVEHIQPKGLKLPSGAMPYVHLIGRWENFLLGCVNCNGTKGDKDVNLAAVLMPDRDNTAHAYVYTADGRVAPSPTLSGVQQGMAAETLSLCGLDKGPNEVTDANGEIVAIDRHEQRIQAWGVALSSKDDLIGSPTDGMRRQIVKTAVATGYFSVWIQVFSDDVIMKRLLIVGFTQAGIRHGFLGTDGSCYDGSGNTRTPRQNNGLPHCSKV